MFEVIYNSETNAALRRCHLSLRKTADDSPYTTAIPGGTKAQLSLNGGAAQASTNDVIMVDSTNLPGAVYVELTPAELTAFVRGNLIGSVTVGTAKTEDFQCTIVPYDPWSATPPDVNLVSAVGHTLSGDGTTTPIHA